MDVEKTIDLGGGHKIEFGTSSWDDDAFSVRNRYPTANGGFSPRSSSELPIEDVKILVSECIKNGYMEHSDILEIMQIAIEELRKIKE